MADTEAVRLLIVDDHELVRVGLKTLLEGVEGLTVAGEAENAAEAVRAARHTHPDVVLMDVRLPDGSGIEACREIRSALPATRVLMLTSYADDEAVFSAIVAGASGYLLKQAKAQDLVQAIRTVSRGASLLDPSVTEKVLQRLRATAETQPQPDNELAQLSHQERSILPLIAEGSTNHEIADALCLSESTVKAYVSTILSKLQLKRRSEA
ncbi:MAG: response regulator transcription factor, partial [Chloroflexota bacterium]|nr:response regulator transcription factor [Chloroflexota bacterium]